MHLHFSLFTASAPRPIQSTCNVCPLRQGPELREVETFAQNIANIGKLRTLFDHLDYLLCRKIYLWFFGYLRPSLLFIVGELAG